MVGSVAPDTDRLKPAVKIVGAGSETPAVANIADVIESSDVRAYSEGVSTGFADLDDSTGGFLPGALWLVLGTPGVGRTLLATQFATHAAVHARVATSLVLGREPSRVALLNIYCQLARASAGRVQRGAETSEESDRVADARRLLRTSPLAVWSSGDGLSPLEHQEHFTAMFNTIDAGEGSGRVVIIDDFDDFYWLYGGDEVTPMLERLRRLRESAIGRQCTVVVTLPEEEWLQGAHARPELRRGVDVILRVVRPDMFAEDSPRAGEADLELLRNRTGRNQTCTVAFQGHYRRFTDMSSG